MTPDLRILFLVFLFLSGFLLIIRTRGAVLGALNLGYVLLDFLLVPTFLITVATFFVLLLRIDPMPFLRESAYQLGFQQLVSYADAIPPNLADNLAVSDVIRQDTDGDDFREWVVFYKFDVKADSSPIQAVIYDNDRGNPPVIFPYALRVPGRDYLSEEYRLESRLIKPEFGLTAVTVDQNGPGGADLPEIMVKSRNELSIFRFKENSQVWDFPRDAPPRYEAIGFFRGSGGVEFDDGTKRVTVIDRDGFERSQLARRSVYAINETNTYWDKDTYWDNLQNNGSMRDLEAKLAAPMISTLDFFAGPPDDILDTAFPEKIVLAFYAATCSDVNVTLCRNAEANWKPQDFLAPNSEALTQFRDNNPGYFGLPGSFGSTSRISVSELCYYPSLETDRDLLETGPGRDVVTGEQAQFNLVDIEFVANGAPLEAARFEVRLADGRWKIARRIELVTPICSDPPPQVLASPGQ